jgi:hypothetical protein
MALNYDEAIAELRAEEKRLTLELEQVRAAIPGMIVLRNRHLAEVKETAASSNGRMLPGIGRFAGMGATKAIPEFLKTAEIALTSREITDGLMAEGWVSEAQKPAGAVSATLINLEKQGVVTRVGEAWKLKVNLPRVSLNPASFSPSERQQPS